MYKLGQKRWDEHNLELTKTIEPITEKLNKNE